MFDGGTVYRSFLFLRKCILELEGWNSPKSLIQSCKYKGQDAARKEGSIADCIAYAHAYACRSLGQEVANA